MPADVAEAPAEEMERVQVGQDRAGQDRAGHDTSACRVRGQFPVM
jgi:hypothetical protein